MRLSSTYFPLPSFFPPVYPDRTVKIFDVTGSTYTHTATLQGHEGPVWQISWSHPKFGSVLASCSFDGSVLFHRESRPREWTLLHAARGLHESSVNGVAFAPHGFGLVAAAAGSDGRVSVLTHREDDSWDVEYVRDNALGVNAVDWAPYDAYDIDSDFGDGVDGGGGDSGNVGNKSPPRPRLVTGGCDNHVRFWVRSADGLSWDENTSSVPAAHTDWVRDVAWAPSIVPGMNLVASCSEDRSVVLWTQEGGEGKPWVPQTLNVFENPVWRLSWSGTGNVLAVSSGDGDVTLWKRTMDGTWGMVGSVDDGARVEES